MSKRIKINKENVREDTLELTEGLIDAQEDAIQQLVDEEITVSK